MVSLLRWSKEIEPPKPLDFVASTYISGSYKLQLVYTQLWDRIQTPMPLNLEIAVINLVFSTTLQK